MTLPFVAGSIPSNAKERDENLFSLFQNAQEKECYLERLLAPDITNDRLHGVRSKDDPKNNFCLLDEALASTYAISFSHQRATETEENTPIYYEHLYFSEDSDAFQELSSDSFDEDQDHDTTGTANDSNSNLSRRKQAKYLVLLCIPGGFFFIVLSYLLYKHIQKRSKTSYFYDVYFSDS